MERACLSTEFPTNMLKNGARDSPDSQVVMTTKIKAVLEDGCRMELSVLAGDFFQQFLVDIEIGVHVLNIVVIFHCFHKTDHCCRR